MIKKHPLLSFLTVLLLAALACNMPEKGATGPDATMTSLASTLNVALTQTALAGGISTALPTITVATVAPSPTITSTTRPPNTAVPPAPLLCDDATFITDVSVPDGTTFLPNQTFVKTWRLKNTGSCTWTTSYSLVFDSGTQMGGPSGVALPGSVAPGQTVDLSVSLTAPSSPGTYRGNWKLRNAYGNTFGIGVNANVAFWVEVKVLSLTTTVTPTSTTVPGSTTVYDFATNYCSAEWRTDAGVLGCPGTEGDVQGFVVRLSNPTLSNGAAAGEAALETVPQNVDTGVISGRFPAITVNSGYHLRTRASCLSGATNCNVTYQINYRSDGGSLTNLASWNLTYAGGVQTIDIDLSALAGHSVEFSFAVTANGAYNQDAALWVAPKIVR